MLTPFAGCLQGEVKGWVVTQTYFKYLWLESCKRFSSPFLLFNNPKWCQVNFPFSCRIYDSIRRSRPALSPLVLLAKGFRWLWEGISTPKPEQPHPAIQTQSRRLSCDRVPYFRLCKSSACKILSIEGCCRLPAKPIGSPFAQID